MTQVEILRQIEHNNSQIREFLSPNEFTLNSVVAKLLKENQDLQAECGHLGHHFVNGYCEYCMASEDDKDE